MMSIGMPYEQYWHGDIFAVETYIEAERIRQKRNDFEQWKQGRYIYIALCCASPLFRVFSGEAKAEPYIENPFFYEMERQERDKQKIAEAERLRAEMFFKQWAKDTAKHFEA